MADAMTGDGIEIRGLRVLCHVGVGDAERAVAQPHRDRPRPRRRPRPRPPRRDAVADTVDYGAVTAAVAAAVTAGDHALLERLAALAADAALGVDARTDRGDRHRPQAPPADPARRRHPPASGSAATR